MKTQILSSLVLSILIVSFATADVRLPAIISDNMVIQADANAPIWGWAEPKEAVTVTIGKEKQTATANADGKWMVKLHIIKTSETPLEMTVTGKNTITVKNILVGQVWLCSGQSNMEMGVMMAGNPKEEVAQANYPQIRLFKVRRNVSDAPQADLTDRSESFGTWYVCSPKDIALAPNKEGEWSGFSAIAYYFGRELHKTLHVPVGLIQSAYGGTPAESWTPLEILKADPDLRPVTDAFDAAMQKYPADYAVYKAALNKWDQDANQAKAEGKTVPEKPAEPMGPNHPFRPAGLYNGMINPIIPFGLKGVIWSQGESNTNNPYQYRKLFASMIQSWRSRWSQGNFPFYFVQIAGYTHPWTPPTTWAQLRESQRKTLDNVPNTGMAVTIDITGDANNVHPPNKQEVGRRLALWALAKTYGKDIEYSGPLYQGMKVDGNKVCLSFTHVDGGLVAKGGELNSFTIAGADRKFVSAHAAIRNGTVIVESSDVNEPVAVRYAWADNPEGCNLYNAAGLPASPFCTNDWTGATDDKK